MDLLAILYPCRSVKTRIEKYLLTKSTKNQNLPTNGKTPRKNRIQAQKNVVRGHGGQKIVSTGPRNVFQRLIFFGGRQKYCI